MRLLHVIMLSYAMRRITFLLCLKKSYTPSPYRCHDQSFHRPPHLLDHPGEISRICASFIGPAHIGRGPGVAFGHEFADPRLQPRLGPPMSAEITNPQIHGVAYPFNQPGPCATPEGHGLCLEHGFENPDHEIMADVEMEEEIDRPVHIGTYPAVLTML